LTTDKDKTRIMRPGKDKRQKPRRRSRAWSFLRLMLLVFLMGFILTGGVAAGLLVGVIKTMPPLSALGKPNPSLTSFVYAANGELIADFHREENRIPVKLEDLPDHVPNAVIAAEDERFWEHHGPDPEGILRALYRDIIARAPREGASTITQQVVKNAFVGTEKTLQRKVKEAILAIQMERKFTKEEILEMYLNAAAFFGRDAHGIQAAAQMFFAKDAADLTLGEAAMLAGILPGPNRYSPFVDPDAARTRQAIVLDKMVQQGMATREEAEAAKNQPIELADPRRSDYRAPHFVDYVLRRAIDLFGEEQVFEGGLKIYTTVDLDIQAAAEQALRNQLDEDFPMPEGAASIENKVLTDAEGRPIPQAAAVVLDPHTGHIKAMVGGRTHTQMLELNRTTQAYHQPGSSFKPVVAYAPAIDLGYTAASIIDDSPVVYRMHDGSIWAPSNYDKKYGGLTTLREGLQRSINVMAVKLLEQIGIETGLDYAARLGISSLVLKGPVNDHALAIALGGLTKGVRPLDMAQVFGAFSNDGVVVEPVSVLKVLDKHDNIIYEANPDSNVVLRPGTAYIVTDMLRSAVEGGTGRPARIEGRAVAGKTGTTTEHYDSWFCGFTPEYVGAVWVGYDVKPEKPRTDIKLWGSTYPARIWKEIMTQAVADLPESDFQQPPNISRGIPVCTESGLRPGPHCPPECVRSEVFVKGTEPRMECNVHVQARICRESGKLATPYCPESGVVTKVFIKRPQPFTPYTDSTGHTYIPADAALEVPTQLCPVHSVPEPPPSGGEDDTGTEDGTGTQPGDEEADGGDGGGQGTGDGDDDGDDRWKYSGDASEDAEDAVTAASGVPEGENADPIGQVVDLSARCYCFTPAQITCRAGDLIRLNITSTDTDHGFALPELGINVRIPAGQTRTVEILPEAPGVYTFYSPPDAGAVYNRMLGQLVVTPPEGQQ